MSKRASGLILSLLLIFTVTATPFLSVKAAAYPTTGTVLTSSDRLNVRSSPTTSSQVVTTLASGTEVTVTGEVNGTAVGGITKWYSITYGSITGYVHSNYIYIAPAYVGSDEFEKELASQNFPESYRVLLRQLHAKYPNWKFTALHTGLKWDSVISAEYGGTSLIDKTATNSWKSYDKGFYNFDTGSFVTFDGGVYHAASRDYLKYCIDPRNFLNDTSIFMFFVARGQTGETEQGVSSILNGMKWTASYPDNGERVYIFTDGSYKITSNKDDTEANTSSEAADIPVEIKPGDQLDGKTVKEIIEVDSYPAAFIAAHKLTGISAYMLASRIRQEQGINGNLSGRGEVAGYEGYYNIWNIKTYGNDKYVQGAKYAKEQGWDTPLKSMIGGSSFLDTNYFKTGQDTLYLQKFDVVDGGNGYYWHEYMTYLPAPASEAAILKRAFTTETIQNEAVFKIPVYTDMPSSACARPTESGNNNSYLKSISVEGWELSSQFDVYKMSYEAIVTDASVKVTAVPYDSGATVSGTGNIALNYGSNTVTLTVTATNGSKRSYTLYIFRNEKEPSPDDPKAPTLTGTVYSVGDYVTRIEPGTAASEFLEGFTVENGTAELLGGDGGKKEGESPVATGDTVVIYGTDGVEAFRYTLLIYGDVNKDGRVNSIDLLVTQRSILGMTQLDTVQSAAANANRDQSVNSVDLLYIQRYILGMTDTIQGDQ